MRGWVRGGESEGGVGGGCVEGGGVGWAGGRGGWGWCGVRRVGKSNDRNHRSGALLSTSYNETRTSHFRGSFSESRVKGKTS